MSSIDDPILKELLDALKQDTQLMASDLLSVITTQALIAVFALFLAIASLARIILYEQTPLRMGGPGPVPGSLCRLGPCGRRERLEPSARLVQQLIGDRQVDRSGIRIDVAHECGQMVEPG